MAIGKIEFKLWKGYHECVLKNVIRIIEILVLYIYLNIADDAFVDTATRLWERSSSQNDINMSLQGQRPNCIMVVRPTTNLQQFAGHHESSI